MLDMDFIVQNPDAVRHAIDVKNVDLDLDAVLMKHGDVKALLAEVEELRHDGNGHTYGHTLLAALVMVLPGVLFLVRRGDPRVLAMGIAMLSHLAVDPTNHSPENLLWPLLGTDFPQVTLLGSKMTVVTESISALMLLAAGYYLHRTNKLRQVIEEGRIQ